MLARLDRLFDAFYTTKPQGLGNWVAICRSCTTASKKRPTRSFGKICARRLISASDDSLIAKMDQNERVVRPLNQDHRN
jgi:hypothetical protein